MRIYVIEKGEYKRIDPNETPVVVILSDNDKKNIAEMGSAEAYGMFPKGSSVENMEKMVDEVKEIERSGT